MPYSDPERRREHSKLYYQKNKGRHSAYMKAWYQANREHHLAHQKATRAKNRPRHLARMKKYNLLSPQTVSAPYAMRSPQYLSVMIMRPDGCGELSANHAILVLGGSRRWARPPPPFRNLYPQNGGLR